MVQWKLRCDFSSLQFKACQVLEDDPWWCPGCHKVLYYKFPKAKFILYTRDSMAWFESMKKHSGGKSLGNTRIHAKIYRRENELVVLLKANKNLQLQDFGIDNILSLDGFDNHHISLYEMHNRELIEFFSKASPDSLFVGKLEDKDKWKKLAAFFDLNIPNDFEVHSNRSN
jgi:hypothetical protein